MQNKNLIETVNKFNGKKILVIGDLMLDEYVWGRVERISPEAPVQVVEVLRESYSPGGAANLANNIASLGGEAYLSGVVGSDNAKNILLNSLKKQKINTSGIVTDRARPTTRKIRVMGHNQQLLRVDYEDKGMVHGLVQGKILSFIKKKISSVDGVVISDYGKGMQNPGLIKKLVSLCREKNKIVVVDSKSNDYKIYNGATLLTPNHNDASKITKIPETTEKDTLLIGKTLAKSLNSNVLLTRGEKGMSLFEKNGKITHIPTKAKEVYDVTGAGDTVAGVVALSLASGASLSEAAMIATHAASVVIGKVGTSTCSLKELKEDILNN